MIKPLSSLLLALSLFLNNAQAAQQIHVAAGDMAVAKLSAKEPTRLSLAGGRILRLLGGEGKLTGIPDEAAGEVYIQPTAAYRSKPFSLFVKSDRGVIRLLLTPVDGPAEDIVLMLSAADQSIIINGKGGRVGDYGKASDWERQHPYELTLTKLIRGMAVGQPPPGFGQVAIGRPVSLWRETDITLLSRYQGANLVGEIYRVKNIDQKTLRFQEPEFYRAGILAVAMEKLLLQPGESSFLYIVSRASVEIAGSEQP